MSDLNNGNISVINIPLNQSRKSSQLGEHSRTRWGNLPFSYVDAIFPIYSMQFCPFIQFEPRGVLSTKDPTGMCR